MEKKIFLLISCLPRIGLPEYGVSVAGHHLAGLEQTPDVVLQLIVRGLQAQFGRNLERKGFASF